MWSRLVWLTVICGYWYGIKWTEPVYALGLATDSLSRAIQSCNARWHVRENAISRLPFPDFQQLTGSYSVSETSVLAQPQPNFRAGFDLPPVFDWRNRQGNWLTPIQNQEKCGSCWAFAPLAALESVIKISRQNPDTCIDLSEQFILACSEGTCAGYWAHKACDFLLETGVPGETFLPYQGIDTLACPLAGASAPPAMTQLSSWSWVTLDTTDIHAIKLALLENPIVSYMQVYEDLAAYGGGVYQHVAGKLTGGHSVLLVGWDDAPAEGGAGCWIVKNSWGTDWGEAGYFRIGYRECRIGTFCIDCNITTAEAEIAISPASISVTLAAGDSQTVPLYLENQGTAPLSYQLTVMHPHYSETMFSENLKRAPLSFTQSNQAPRTRSVTPPLKTAVSVKSLADVHSQLKDQLAFAKKKPSPGKILVGTNRPPDVLTSGASATGYYIKEDFEHGQFLPPDWQKQDGRGRKGGKFNPHWQLNELQYAFQGIYGVVCGWGYGIDEWLISPSLDFSQVVAPQLTFYWMSNYTWSVYPHDNADLWVKITTDSGRTWQTVWAFDEIGPWNNWQWYQTCLDLSAFAGKSHVQIAFQVKGDDNADVALDQIVVQADAWLSVWPDAGWLPPDSTVTLETEIKTSIGAKGLTPGNYEAQLSITSDDPDEVTIQIPVYLQVPRPRLTTHFDPDVVCLTANLGDTIQFSNTLINSGQQAEAVFFEIQTGSSFGHALFNGATRLTPGPGGQIQLVPGVRYTLAVQLMVPHVIPVGINDTTYILLKAVDEPMLADTLTIITQIRTPLPWAETFISNSLDSIRWQSCSGRAEIIRMPFNVPSAPYVIRLTGESTGAALVSQRISRNQDEKLIVSFYYCQNSAAPGSQFGVQFFNGDQWVTIWETLSKVTKSAKFRYVEVVLPPDVFHPDFRLKFFVTASNIAASWLIDNIYLANPAKIQIISNPDPIVFNVVRGKSENGTLQIQNIGSSPLEFWIDRADRPDDFLLNQYQQPKPTPSWLTYTPTMGIVAPDSGLEVQITVSSNHLPTGVSFMQEVLISTNDLDRDVITVPIVLNIVTSDYAFESWLDSTYRVQNQETVSQNFHFQICNTGLRADTYNFSARWQHVALPIWETGNLTPIHGSPELQPGEKFDFMIQTAPVTENHPGNRMAPELEIHSQRAVALTKRFQLTTSSMGPMTELLWSVTPDSTEIRHWTLNLPGTFLNSGAATCVTQMTATTPRGIALETSPIISATIDLAHETALQLSYRVRGIGERTIRNRTWFGIDYQNAHGEWMNLILQANSDSFNTVGATEYVSLPAAAQHSMSRFRFYVQSTTTVQPEWLLETVQLTALPPFEFKFEELAAPNLPGDCTWVSYPFSLRHSAPTKQAFQIVATPAPISATDGAVILLNPDWYLTQPPFPGFLPDQGSMFGEGFPDATEANGSGQGFYKWLKRSLPNAPDYRRIEKNLIGDHFTGHNDDTLVGPFAIGFPFNFADQIFSHFAFDRNGLITFLQSDTEIRRGGFYRPDSHYFIAPLGLQAQWNENSQRDFKFDGEKLMVYFQQLQLSENSANTSFQLWLRPDGQMKLYYFTPGGLPPTAQLLLQVGNSNQSIPIPLQNISYPDTSSLTIMQPLSGLKFQCQRGWIEPNTLAENHLLIDLKHFNSATTLQAQILLFDAAATLIQEIPVMLESPASHAAFNPELVPEALTLAQNYPNPFNLSTSIAFQLPRTGLATLEIYNSVGQQVHTLLKSSLAAGRHQLNWNGLDHRGNRAGAGIYFYRLKFESEIQVRKLLLLP